MTYLRHVITYNADFDLRLLKQSLAAAGLDPAHLNAWWHCAMLGYAAFHAQPSRRGEWKWQTLNAAAEQCGLPWPSLAHRALVDAQMCRRVVMRMASQAPAPQPASQDHLLQ
jgi:DNA polymerase-3 subunit epsilon